MRRLLIAMLLLGAGCFSLPLIRRSTRERWGFSAPWDSRSASSIRAHGATLNGVVLAWIALDSLTGLPYEPYRDSLFATLPTAVRRMGLVTSWIGDRFNPAIIRRLGGDPAALSNTASAIGDRLERDGYRGVVVDFEGMTAADTATLRTVVAAIAGAVRARGAGPVVVAIPPGDTAAYPARLFTSSADLLLMMLYDEHWATSPPGPIASPEWVRRMLALRVAEGGPSRLVASLPLYGYLWRANRPAEVISFTDATRLAAEAGVALQRDAANGTLHASRSGSDGWELWVSDATLLQALEHEVAQLGVRHVAYWRLGLEDPAMWGPPVTPR